MRRPWVDTRTAINHIYNYREQFFSRGDRSNPNMNTQLPRARSVRILALTTMVLILTACDKAKNTPADRETSVTPNTSGSTGSATTGATSVDPKVYGYSSDPGLHSIADNSKVTEENFDRVKKEMSLEQVEAILGPGERIPRTEIYKILHQPTPKKVTDKTTVVKWKNGGDTIILEWVADGTIVWNSYVRDQGQGKPPLSRGLGFPRLQ
jgi:hypothetical protein